MFATLFLSTLLAISCEALPARPSLRWTFSSVLWANQSATGSMPFEGTSNIAIDATAHAIVEQAPLLDGRVTTTITSFSDSNQDGAGLWASQPFFNWTICYIYPVPSIGPPSSYDPETFVQAIEQLIDMRLDNYNQTTFNGTDQVDGMPCDRWVWSVMGGAEIMEFCVVRDSGALLSVNRSYTSATIFEHAQNVFHEYKAQPDPAQFVLPQGCVDLRALRTVSDQQVNDAARIERINEEAQGLWTAEPNRLFDGGVTLTGAKQRLMQKPSGFWGRPLALRPVNLALQQVALPNAFDARTNWKQCQSITRVRDQGLCGSCWAFSAAEVLADRYCITNPSAAKVNNLTLSVEYLLDCDNNDNGCGGGLLDDAWRFLNARGLPEESCIPYQQYRGSTNIPCYAISTKCIEQPSSPFELHQAASAYAVAGPGRAHDMQLDIFAHGPIQVGFQVFSDFHSYHNGTYFRTPSATGPDGGHAVKIVGWGTDEHNIDYWVVANSWGANWGGLGGFFHIRRGTNECGIEQTPAAGLVPQLVGSDADAISFV